MARYELLFPSRYLSAADLGGKPVDVRIKGIRLGEIDATEEINGRTTDVKKQKAIITLEGVAKEWLLNRTNGEALALIFGPDTKTWRDQPITLHGEMVKSFTEMVLALRVKGSPLLEKPLEKTVRRGRRKLQIRVVPTGKANAVTEKPAPNPLSTDDDYPPDEIASGQASAAEPGGEA